ncbi:Rha family transcriptional regulator [Bacillus safensis]|uniref:DNA-binding protein n=5 Tax=Bacillus safensis TaxID=561879 RepID=A0A1L6ZF22_BACIA|nr:Rha family transcriptional regulator [Bacillus safensis]APT45096.1 DNA-binding protein [Bacillus safensis]MCW4645831.1 Rha family transcriptional regulator [Bacillus safensis]
MENNLQVIEQNGQLLVDSREVAEMVDKRHADLVRSIESYLVVIGQNAKLRSDDFFIESTYQAGTGKLYKHYLLTKQGCEMVANKMTGEKGVLFTAAYVTQFNEMEQNLQSFSNLSPQLQQMIRLEQRQNETDQRIGKLENNLGINAYQQTVIQKRINKRVYELVERYGEDSEGKRRMFSSIHRNFRDAFAVPTYKDLRKLDFEEAISWIGTWRPLI